MNIEAKEFKIPVLCENDAVDLLNIRSKREQRQELPRCLELLLL